MPNIIDEIAEARHYFSYEGKECNTIIIPESRRFELQNEALAFTRDVPFDPNVKHTVFGCEVIYSWNADKIKVGYMI